MFLKPKSNLEETPGDYDDDYYPPPEKQGFFKKLRNKVRAFFSGPTGAVGMMGARGEMGMPGKSDYELAQSVGFQGTLLEWLDPDIKKAFLLEKNQKNQEDNPSER